MTFPENEILEILFRKESLIETKSLGLFPQRANSIRQPGAMVMFTREDKMKYIFCTRISSFILLYRIINV